jgi:hypothetical protein
MLRRGLIPLVLLCAVILAVSTPTLFAQDCPNSDPSVCSAEYDDCLINCPGKDGDWQTCPNHVCPDAYDFCMNGYTYASAWTYPVVSKTVSRACIWGCTAWACLCGPDNLTQYAEYDTHYQEVKTETRNCPDNTTITVVVQTIDHPSRTCYFRTDQNQDGCTYHNGVPDNICIHNQDCFINESGDSVRFNTTP